MKLICSKSNMLKSINISMKAVPSRTTMTILECILIDASSSQIKFISNDMELGIETITEGMILEKVSLLWMQRYFMKSYVVFPTVMYPLRATVIMFLR